MTGFLVTEVEAKRRLDVAIERSGGLRAYAEKLRVSPGFISKCKRDKITGAVLIDLGLEPVYQYRETGTAEGTLQKQYENQRRARCIETGTPVERWNTPRGRK